MSTVTLDICAHEVLETIPLVMRTVRAEMRRGRGTSLSVPQFRTLGFVSRQAGASLSAAAEHVGLTLPSMSALVDGLVARKLIARGPDAADRRRVTLTLTPRGRAILSRAHRATQAHLARRLAALPVEDRGAVAAALRTLRSVFEAGALGR